MCLQLLCLILGGDSCGWEGESGSREPAAQRRPRNSGVQFRKFTLNTRYVLGPVNAEVRLVCFQYPNSKAVLECPQLFERFRLFQRRRAQLREGAKDGALIAVQTDVPAGQGSGAVRDRGAGKVEG